MKSTILIVDDEEDLRYVFKIHLEKKGYEIYTAEDYDSALEIISETDLDLIITDIILGSHTGIDLLRKIKEKRLACPVVMITAAPSLGTAIEAVRLGAFDYLPKPISKEILIRVTQYALQQKELRERYRRNLEAIFRSVKDAIITVDNEMHVIEANNAVDLICNVSPESIKGADLAEVSFGCSKSCLQTLSETLRTQNAVDEYRVECKRKDRPHQMALVSSSPLLDHDDSFIGAVMVCRDITRLISLELELKKRFQFHEIIGKSEKMQAVYRLLTDLSTTDTTVIITGETGTGKELAAKALHYESNRSEGPFVSVNCSALSENLLESELFGHVKGAFTGAVKDKKGRFQIADKGSIFLDEIGNISPVIQLKLLRFLQEKEFEQVGDSSPVKVDVRVIAATNRDLKEMVRLGEFREDLYYRLRVVEVALPPLRERREDIPILVDHFRDLFEKKMNKEIDGVSSEVMTAFMKYSWPGNLRELEHAMEYAFVVCRDRTVALDHLPSEIREYSGKRHIAASGIKSNTDSRNILDALTRTGWNKAKAARLLRIDRSTIYRKIKEYNLVTPG